MTFDANGHGEAPEAQALAYGKTAAEPEEPTEDGWTFGGWYTDAGCTEQFSFETPIKADITLYAKWTENDSEEPSDPGVTKFTISYDLNGGTLDGKTGVITVEAEEGTTITIPGAPTREGYTFTYWKGSKYYPGDKYTVEGDHTFTAEWEQNEAKTYKVTFNANGHGTAPSAQAVEEGKKAAKPADPTASGYTFGGWFTDKECKNAYSFDTAVTQDITLYAKWTKDSSSSDGSGGSSSSASGGKSVSSSSTADKTAVKTGDVSNIGLWFMLMAASLIGLVMTAIRRKKFRR